MRDTIIVSSLAQNPVQHAVSAATISAGAVGKYKESIEVDVYASFMGYASDIAIVAGLVLTVSLIYGAYKADKLRDLNIELTKLQIAKEGRRDRDSIT